MVPTRKSVPRSSRPHEDPLMIVKRRKLLWYGHVSRLSGLAKTILQSTVKGGRRHGRQRKRWEDSIREWTGLEFGKSQRTVENRKKWRKLIAELCSAPTTLAIKGLIMVMMMMMMTTTMIRAQTQDIFPPFSRRQKTRHACCKFFAQAK